MDTFRDEAPREDIAALNAWLLYQTAVVRWAERLTLSNCDTALDVRPWPCGRASRISEREGARDEHVKNPSSIPWSEVRRRLLG